MEEDTTSNSSVNPSFILEDKRRKLSAILKDGNNNLADMQNKIVEDNLKNKEKRFEIARKINELRKKQEEEESNKQKLERDLIALKKESAVRYSIFNFLLLICIYVSS
jgi:hypothetical protein